MTIQTKLQEIQNLRLKSIGKTIEAVLVLITALFVSALLPGLLIRYVYATQQLFEQPKPLEYIPVGAFVIGIFYFLLAMGGNIRRERRVARLEQEIKDLEFSGCCGCGCDSCDNSDEDWMKEWKEEDLSLDEEKVATKASDKKTPKARSKKTKKSK